MGIKLVTFAAQTVTPQDDALIYETALQESGMIYGGVVTIKNANVLHVDAGHGALCGRKFTIEATDVSVPLTASGSLQGRIYIHMDLSDTGEPISFQVETASSLTPVIQQADVNINSGIYEINLATFIVDTSTISNLVNVAPFIDIEPDSGFNAQSNNPVQNKVITKAVGVPETIGGLASQEYNIGDTLVATDGQFYDVIAHISPNATIVLNGNVTLGGNIVDLINSLSSQISNLEKAIDISTNLSAYDVYAQNVAITGISAYKCGKVILLSVNMSLYQGFSHDTSIFKIKTFPAKLKAPTNWLTPIWSISLGKVIGFMRLAWGTDYINFYIAGNSIAGDQYNNISTVIFCGQD